MNLAHAVALEEDAPAISIIIPALDEAEMLPAALASIAFGAARHEVIVVDAGSVDETSAIANRAGAAVISCARRQRAHQLNLGARQARGSVLLFMHADTLLPAGALDHLAAELRDSRIVGGAFARRYATRSVFLQMTCALARWRNETLGWHLGDQAMFVRRSVFFQLGGFRDADIFEDLDFSRRLKQFGKLATLSPGVTSSARRFAGSPAKRTLRDLRLTINYLIQGLPRSRALHETQPGPLGREQARLLTGDL